MVWDWIRCTIWGSSRWLCLEYVVASTFVYNEFKRSLLAYLLYWQLTLYSNEFPIVPSAGYYRVNYDEANWRLLTQQLLNQHTAIHVTNRAQILDDAFNLARAGEFSIHSTLCLLSSHVGWFWRLFTLAQSSFSFIHSLTLRLIYIIHTAATLVMHSVRL